MPLLSSFTQIGVREELADYVAVVDAKSTPFVSMAPKGKDIGNMTFSWQVDNYSAPIQSNIFDGVDVATADHTNASASRAKMTNTAQVFRRNHRTGFIAETSNVAGVSSETAKGVAKRLVELKRDMEATFLSAQTSTPSSLYSSPPLSTATASTTASLGYTLQTAAGAGAGLAPTGYGVAAAALLGGNGNGATVTAASITESTIQDVLAGIYSNTGTIRDYDMICGTTLRRAMTNLADAKQVSTSSAGVTGFAATSIRTFNKEIGDATYKSSVDVFEGDFGRLLIQPDVFIGGFATQATGGGTPAGNGALHTAIPFKGYIIPSDMVEIRYAKLPEVKDLPDAGGGPIKLIQAIAGLIVKNPAGFGMFNCIS